MSSLTMTASVSSAPRRRIAAVLTALGWFPQSVQQLLFRIAVGSVFFKAGLVKVQSWETTVALFRDEYQVPLFSPELAAGLASTVELGCSALLVAGLATRVATLPLLGMLAVIQLFVYPSAWPEHLVWGSILIALLTRGAGTLSVDRLIGAEPETPAGVAR